MPTLVIPKTYRDGKAPRVSDLDNIRLSIESFFNSTRLDNANIDLAAISAAISAAQAKTLIDTSEIGQVEEQVNTTTYPSVTVEASGYYIIFAQMDQIVSVATEAPNIASASATEEINLAINGINVIAKDISHTYVVDATQTSFRTSQLGQIAGITRIATLTVGDVITLDVPGSISLIKLYET